MSKVFNMVGGGGGKNISSIIITGLKSTDTITCTKDGKSYTATWDSTAQHWEIVGLPLGTFTVTATNGTNTITETVLIDIAGVYEIEVDLTKLYLYRDGNECENITGGWVVKNIRTDSDLTAGAIKGNGILSKENTYMELSMNPYHPYRTTICTNNKINFSGKSKICISRDQSTELYLAISASCEDGFSPTVFNSVTVKEYSSDISLSGEYYVIIYLANVESTGKIFKIWIE